MRTQRRTRTLTRRKHVVFSLIYLVVLAAVTVVAAELLVRLHGIEPWRVLDLPIRVTPGGRFYATHPELGYAHLPGAFVVTLADGYAFTVTHLPNTLRVTHPLPTDATARPRPEIWLFGCSFTHGWSLNDEETYPWALQERLPAYAVVNYGVGGYGTIHALLQLREALHTRPPPVVAVYAYAGFHDERNTFLRRRRKGVALWNRLGPLTQPYVRLTATGTLRFAFAAVEYRELPLMRSSALVHFLEMTYNHVEERVADSHEVSKRLVLEMASLARQARVPLVVAGIMDDEPTRDMLTFARDHGLAAVELAYGLTADTYWNLPHDGGHPSPRGTVKYAERLEGFMRHQVLTPDRAPVDRPPW
jgi:lysophospholipase L1-like esterase